MSSPHQPCPSRAVDAPLRVHQAQGYWQRMRGLLGSRAMASDVAFKISPCNSVHTAGMRYAIDVVFVDRRGRILKVVPQLAPWRVAVCWRALAAYELAGGVAEARGIVAGGLWVSEGHTRHSIHSPLACSQRGATTTEMVVLLPAALLTLLLILQSALIYHAKNQLNVAAVHAAREGALDHARVSAIRNGFARGLVPLLGGGRDVAELATALIHARLEAELAHVEILSPLQESFDDYASPLEAARLVREGMDGLSEPVIQNMSIGGRECPYGRDGTGGSTRCNGNPTSNASGQSLQDANMLKVRIVWGLPRAKQVPIVGPLMVQLLRLGAIAQPAENIAILAAGRIPIVSTAIVRMQTEPIRNAAMAGTRRNPSITNPATGVFAAITPAPAPGQPGDPGTTPPGAPVPEPEPVAPPPPPPPANAPPPNPFPGGVPTPAPAPAPAPVPPITNPGDNIGPICPSPTPAPSPVPAPVTG